MIYFDNAATTFPKPPQVISEVLKCITEYCGNHGRSSHYFALKTSEKIYEAREKIAKFIDVDSPERVVFTQNATQALNLAIKTTVKPETHVIISDLEHNSVIRPLYALKKKSNVDYSVFNTNGDISANIEELIRPNTKYIVSTLMSNVNGKEVDLASLTKTAKKHNLKLIVDASQIIGHKEILFSQNKFDVLCAPSHKSIFGIQGAGFAIFCDDEIRETLYEGGSGSASFSLDMPDEYPERFEAGTLPAPSIISMIDGIEFIEKNGLVNINRKLKALTQRAAEMLLEIKDTAVYENGNGIVSFTISDIPVSLISYELEKRGICTRSGLHCAPIAHQTIGTSHSGTVRISFSCLNDCCELDAMYIALKEIEKIYL